MPISKFCTSIWNLQPESFTVLDVPFSYNELFETCCKCLLEQNELGQESSEIGDFWNTLQGLHASGKFIEGVHFNIRYLNSFRPISATEDMQFKEAKPIIYLNAGSVAPFSPEKEAMFHRRARIGQLYCHI